MPGICAVAAPAPSSSSTPRPSSLGKSDQGELVLPHEIERIEAIRPLEYRSD